MNGVFVSQDGYLMTSIGLPFLKNGKAVRYIGFNSGSTTGNQLAQPLAADIFEIQKTSAEFAYLKPLNATGFEVERSTDFNFTQNLTSVYSGPKQAVDIAGLLENTKYFVRMRATAVGFTPSEWLIMSFKTFWNPSAASQGGNRFASAQDAITYANYNVNEGDYIIVGWNDGGTVPAGEFGPHGVNIDSAGSSFGQQPLSAFASIDNKVVIIGGRGYDWCYIKMTNWQGTALKRRIITNGGGQVIINNFSIDDNVHTELTGHYDPVAKTGDPDFRGMYSPSWSRLNGSYGFYMRGKWRNFQSFGFHSAGRTNDFKIRGCQFGGGNYTGLSVKNDGYPLRDINNTERKYQVTDTGGAWVTMTLTGIVFTYDVQRLRAYADWNNGGGANVKLNWIEFEDQSTLSVIRIEAENTIGRLRMSNEACGDVGGGLNVTGFIETGTFQATHMVEYDQFIPRGTYTVRVRVKAVGSSILTLRTGSTLIDGLEINQCHFADFPVGEAFYLESTQPDSQQHATNVWIHDNIFARAALNSVQTGQMVGFNRIENNVGINSAMGWTNTFQRFQDQHIQQSIRAGGLQVKNNMWVGCGGESFINCFLLRKFGVTSELSTIFDNNAFLNLTNYMTGYIYSKDPNFPVIDFTNNVIGRQGNGLYEGLLYPGWNRFDSAIILEAGTDPEFMEDYEVGNAVMNVSGNVTDFSINAGGPFVRKQGNQSGLTVNVGAGNVRQAAVPYPLWNGYMGLADNYALENMEFFTAGLSPQWNRYNTPGTLAVNGNSVTPIVIPFAPTQITLTVITEANSFGGNFSAMEPGRTWIVGEYVVIQNSIATAGNYFVGQVVSFSNVTGVLVVNTIAHFGSGAQFSVWRISRARIYPVGQIVSLDGRYFESLINNNISNEPPRDGNDKWKLIIFPNGSLKPMDDVRLRVGDYYRGRGMGLTFVAP